MKWWKWVIPFVYFNSALNWSVDKVLSTDNDKYFVYWLMYSTSNMVLIILTLIFVCIKFNL